MMDEAINGLVVSEVELSVVCHIRKYIAERGLTNVQHSRKIRLYQIFISALSQCRMPRENGAHIVLPFKTQQKTRILFS